MEKMKRGVWSPEEDAKLIQYIKEHGHGTWRHLPKHAGFLFLFLFFFSFVFSFKKKKSRFEIFVKALAEADHLWVKNSWYALHFLKVINFLLQMLS